MSSMSLSIEGRDDKHAPSQVLIYNALFYDHHLLDSYVC